MQEAARQLYMDYATMSGSLNSDFIKHKYSQGTVKKVIKYSAKHKYHGRHLPAALNRMTGNINYPEFTCGWKYPSGGEFGDRRLL